jgi:hypothetical protein
VTTPGTGFGVSPLRIALLAAAAVYLDGLYLFRHAHFAWAVGLCLSAAGMGHSVGTINDNSLGMAKTSANAFDRLIPRTLFAWGFVSVVAAFVLLGLGALMSMIRKDATPRVAVEEGVEDVV